MRTAGFPCRLLGCAYVFQVIDQRSMDALHAASALRSEHEVRAHDYHHVRIADERSFNAYQRGKPRPPAPK